MKVILSQPFDAAHGWGVGRTWSYPNAGPTNPGNSKLDYLSTSRSAVLSRGDFYATRRPDGLYTSSLVTTEPVAGGSGFQLRPGDRVTATVTLPSADHGSWPGIWTWGDDGPGHGEVDLLEWHPDKGDLWEMHNHVGGTTHYDRGVAWPGRTVRLEARLEAAGVRWYLNDRLRHVGGALPASWRAHIIVNMSVSSGKWHPAPTVSKLHFSVRDFKVWR